MTKATITIANRSNGRTTTVRAEKTDGYHIYSITAAQFDRIIEKLNHGTIECHDGLVSAYRRNGDFYATINPSDSF